MLFNMDMKNVKLELENFVSNTLAVETNSEYLNIVSLKSGDSEVQHCCINSLEEMTICEGAGNGKSDNFTARIRVGHKIFCRFCNRVYPRLESFKQHMNTHSKHQVFQCDFCSNKYLIKDSLRTHIRRSRIRIVSIYVCSICKKNYNNESQLQMHWCSRSFCTSIYFSKQSLLKHFQEAHKDNLDGQKKKSCEVHNEKFVDEMELKEHLKEKPYTCVICQKNFLNEREFVVHKTEHSDKTSPFQCEFCPNSYTIRDSLRTHIRRNHKSDKPSEKGKKDDDLYCDVCGETFHAQCDLTKHMNENIYKCNLCQKHWSNLRTFKYHMNKHSDEQQVYKCEFCDKSYMILDSLKIHIRRHHRDAARKQEEGKRKPRAHRCNICNEFFSKSVRLREHMSLHSKLMLMECQVCGAEFVSRDGLRQHIQETHRCASTEKLYTCTMCDKQFGRYFLLSQHMQQHRGGKPHRCEECARQFSSCVHLEVHKRRRHEGIKPYSCDVCGQTFFRRKFMMLHTC